MYELHFKRTYNNMSKVVVANSTYYFRTYYNNVIDRWFIDIYSAKKELLIAGIKLAQNVSLLSFYVNEKLPNAILFVPTPEGVYVTDETFCNTTFLTVLER